MKTPTTTPTPAIIVRSSPTVTTAAVFALGLSLACVCLLGFLMGRVDAIETKAELGDSDFYVTEWTEPLVSCSTTDNPATPRSRWECEGDILSIAEMATHLGAETVIHMPAQHVELP